MPRKDLICSTCGTVVPDYAYSIHVQTPYPLCPLDSRHGPLNWSPSYGSSRGTFVPFTTTYHGESIHLPDLQALRRLEARSLKDYQEGRGTPHIFREFAQDSSNRDVHAIMPKDPAQQLHDQLDRASRDRPRRRPPVTGRVISEQEAHARENWRGER